MSCSVCAGLRQYGYNLLYGIDVGFNILTGGGRRQTFSARLGRAELAGKPWARGFCRVLSWVFREENHCVRYIVPGDNEGEVVDLDGEVDTLSPEDRFRYLDNGGQP